jgi:phosphomannomutase
MAVGVMVTASHNPKEDNGFKVYWSNGSQIIPPHDEGIAASIMANLEPWTTYDTSETAVVSHANFHDATAAIATAYFLGIKSLSVPAAAPTSPLRIAYTGTELYIQHVMIVDSKLCGV